MPEVASIFTGAQIGKESTPGTSVAASKLLRATSFAPGIEIEFNPFRPMGSLVPTTVSVGKDSTSWDITGQGSYSEMPYIFCSLLHTTTPATVETTARRWTWTPAWNTENTPDTYTVESGSATRAAKATYVLINGTEMTFNRSAGVEISGSAFGQQIQDNITLTASPTQIAEKQILATHLDFYVDTTSGGVGSTKLTRAFEAVFRVGDRWGQVWPVNSANASYASHVVTEPTFEIDISVAADSTGMGLLPNARAGDTRYIRLSAVSTENAGATAAKYDLWIDMAGKITAINDYGGDFEGIKIVRYTFSGTLDSAWGSGQFLTIRNTNQIAAL